MQFFSPLSLRSLNMSTTDSGTDIDSTLEVPGGLSDTSSLGSFSPRATPNRRTADPADRRLREMRREISSIPTVCCWPELLNSFFPQLPIYRHLQHRRPGIQRC